MSYQGGLDYMPVTTVDEVSDYTDMMGQASASNLAQSNKRAWTESPTRMLLCLWFVVIGLYFLLGYFFRRHLA